MTAPAKGGTIRALTERLSPRVFRVVALPAPSDREKSQVYMQRYLQHFPAAGEVVIFDRSWYNRAGVEHILSLIPYKKVPHEEVKLARRSGKGAYNDEKSIARRRWVRERH